MHEANVADSINDILITEELARRPSRTPDYAAENRALLALMQELASNPAGGLQKVAELAMQLCDADSAGISVLEPGGRNRMLRWQAVAGRLAAKLGRIVSRDDTPCGAVISSNKVLLFSGAERVFPALRDLDQPIYENLLAPWAVNGHVIGTLWVMTHRPTHHFDSEDARLLRDFTRFASAAWSHIERMRIAEEMRAEHRATLNLMEDAIEAREAAERASAELRVSEARQAFLVRLSDTLRPLVDAIKIQTEACRLLGEHLQVNRAVYADIEGDECIVRPSFVCDVAPFVGRFPLTAFGKTVLEAYRRGQTITVNDVRTDPRFTDDERAVFASIDVVAFTGLVLFKRDQWVGAFGIHSATPRVWTEADVQLTREVAGRISEAVERVRAEEALRRSEERLQQAISIETVGVIFFNLDGTITAANEAFHRMSGYGRSDIEQGRALWTKMTPPEFIPATMKSLEEFRTEGKNTPYEKQYIRPNGTRWWGLFAGKRLSENEYVEFVVDITASKTAQEALQASEEQFRRAIEDAPIPVIMHAEDGQVLQISRTWTELTGYSADDIPTFEAWLNRAYGSGAEKLREHVQRIFKGDERQLDTEMEVTTRAGEKRHWSFSASAPGTLRDGRRYIVGMALDISERRQHEETLKRHCEQLAAALREAERARDQAEAAGRAKDHFLAVLSHELRTPLNPVMIATRMLSRRKDLPAGMAETVEMIQRNVKLEAQFIDELLDLTRIARGKMELNREPLELHTTVWHAIQVVDPDIQAKKQQMVVSLEAKEQQVLGDATRLQQVFWNLLKNASKFTPEGGEIRIASRNEPGRVVVEVQDTGMGFESDAAERIFAAFEQASEAVTREFGGLGLGLAISKASVDAHGGELRAWSAGHNQGATFTVSLPLSSKAANDVAGSP